MNKSETNDVIVSIHRTENINSKERMRLLVESISNISKNFNVTWYLHIPTKNKLKSFGLLNSLIKNNVVTEELIEYDIFINKLNNSQFVITDGGGVVEECSIIGIPTLVWRNEHMDQDHIFEKSKNLFLCDYQEKNIDYFFKNKISNLL